MSTAVSSPNSAKLQARAARRRALSGRKAQSSALAASPSLQRGLKRGSEGVRQSAKRISNRVQIKALRPGQSCGLIERFGVLRFAWQVVAGVERAGVAAIQCLGEQSGRQIGGRRVQASPVRSIIWLGSIPK